MKSSAGLRVSTVICAAILSIAAFSFISVPTHAEGAYARAKKAAQDAVALAKELAKKCKEPAASLEAAAAKAEAAAAAAEAEARKAKDEADEAMKGQKGPIPNSNDSFADGAAEAADEAAAAADKAQDEAQKAGGKDNEKNKAAADAEARVKEAEKRVDADDNSAAASDKEQQDPELQRIKEAMRSKRKQARAARRAAAKARRDADAAKEAARKPCADAEAARAAAEEALQKAEEALAEKSGESGNKPPKKLVEEKASLDKLRKDLQGNIVKPGDAQASVITKASDSTRVINFDTSAGRIVVNLPDDMMAGDTISGTVIAEPKGTNEAERRRNLAELSGFVVELRPPVMANASSSFIGDTGNNRIQRVAPLSDPNGAVQSNVVFVGDTANNRIQRSTDGGRTWQNFTGSTGSGDSNGGAPGPQNPPRALFRSMDSGASWQVIDSNSRAFTLRLDQGPEGVKVGLNRLTPEDPLPGRTLVVTTIPNNNSANRTDFGNRFTIPTYGQQGRPVVISGPFDGDFQNTTVTVKDSDARILTESPRGITFQSPTNIAGPVDVVIREGNVETKGTYRNVDVKLTAPKTNLLRGEKTELRIEVSGLEGIKEPVPLTLESRGVITMEGGMYQPLVIQPLQVSADGRYSTTRGITGVQAGGWSATATVVTSSMDVKIEDQNCDRRLSLNSSTGEYSFNCPGCSFTLSDGTLMTREQFAVFSVMPIGRGTVTQKDCVITLEDNATDRRVMATIDQCTKTGSATVEVPANKAKFTITDRNTADNTCPVP